MKKKQLYGRGVPMLCIACQLTVAPLFFSSRVQAVPVRLRVHSHGLNPHLPAGAGDPLRPS